MVISKQNSIAKYCRMITLSEANTLLTENVTNVPKVFLDCDGVLADFHTTFMELFGLKAHHEVNEYLAVPGAWETVGQEHPDLFNKLAVLPDAPQLVNTLVRLRDNGVIRLNMLTALPGDWLTGPGRKYGVNAANDKRHWVTRNFRGIPAADIIVCARKDKPAYGIADKLISNQKPVLIDDFKRNTVEWIAQTRGYAIQHTSARSSLTQLGVFLKGLEIDNE